jgi:hypothetical protein
VGKSEERRPLGRPKWRWVDIIRMDLGEIESGVVDSIDLSEDRNGRSALVNAAMNFFGLREMMGIS